MDTNARAARRLLTRFLTAAGIAAGVAAVGTAQQPDGPRVRATLLPPRPLEPHEKPPIARGAIDDLPFTAPPLPKANFAAPASRPATTGPAWLTGAADPNVRQASATTRPMPLTPTKSGVKPTDEAPSFMARGLGKLKSTVGVEKPRPGGEGAAAQPKRETATSNTPFQGTAANGAPVYAGPPAYRWFGYGSVTPGTNALAPTGQYPKASAEWHRLTGATPGAVPVPVTNPARSPAGIDPPAYQQPPPVVRTQAPTPAETARVASSPISADVPRFVPQPAYVEPQKFIPPPAAVEPPVFLPERLPPPPTPTPAPEVAPPGVPTMTPPPLSRPAISVPPITPLVSLPPEPEPAKLVTPVVSETIAPPATDNPQWQATPDTPAAPGTWTKPATADGAWQPGASNTTAQPVARAQAPQSQQPDPTATLIQTLCRHRATEVDVRYVGTKKLSVCFEVRTEGDAIRLVRDISSRKELFAFQIGFCVLVK